MNLRIDQVKIPEYILEKLEQNNLWIEKGTTSTYLIKPTIEQIYKFFEKPCKKHDLKEGILVFDEPGYPYDLRYCAICNKSVGYI